MSLTWITENPARWDGPKQSIVGAAPVGIFDSRFAELDEGDALPGAWWRVEKDGEPIAFGWLDAVWGDAEITLAVADDARGAGVGTFALQQLEKEAKARGLNRLYNIVRPTHPDHDATTAWFTKRGFELREDGSLVREVPAR